MSLCLQYSSQHNITSRKIPLAHNLSGGKERVRYTFNFHSISGHCWEAHFSHASYGTAWVLAQIDHVGEKGNRKRCRGSQWPVCIILMIAPHCGLTLPGTLTEWDNPQNTPVQLGSATCGPVSRRNPAISSMWVDGQSSSLFQWQKIASSLAQPNLVVQPAASTGQWAQSASFITGRAQSTVLLHFEPKSWALPKSKAQQMNPLNQGPVRGPLWSWSPATSSALCNSEILQAIPPNFRA